MSRSPHPVPQAGGDRPRVTRVPNQTGEFDGDVSEMNEDFVEGDDEDGTVQAVSGVADQTKPVDDPAAAAAGDRDPDASGRVRARRSTVISPIPAMLAASMTTLPEAKPPTPLPGHLSAVVSGRAGHHDSGGAYTVQVESDAEADRYNRVSDLIAAMRDAFDVRDFHMAARLAEEAKSAADALGTPAVQDLLADAQPMFERVLAAFVGPLGCTPVLARPWEEIASHRLGDSMRSFLSRIDGVRTLEQTLGHSSIPPQHALRIAASALRAGFIKIAQ